LHEVAFLSAEATDQGNMGGSQVCSAEVGPQCPAV